MRYHYPLAFVLLLSLNPYAHASVSEVEPNSTVAGAAVWQSPDPLYRRVREIDITGQFNDTANQDPSLSTPFSLTDEMVGQLHDTRDYDWFYVDISDSNHPVTPIYFGCDKKLGFYHEGPKDFTVGDLNKDVYWQLEYYYDSDPRTPGGVERQSSYVVYPDTCKRGLAETKGPMRFQMNTQRPGRYYVRVWGRLIATPVTIEDQIEINGEKKTRKTDHDEIVVPTADYTLRLYTARVGGELEPNDGMVEAYALTSGVTVPAQLSSMHDQDWFYIDNDVSKNTTKKLPFYFNCKGQTGKTYILSAYDYLGVLQSNYEVKAEQCNGSAGFSFTIDAPISNRYYFEVSSPTYTENDQFTQADYSVLVIAGPGPTTPDTPVRKDGDLEPNEKQVDAYPLPKNVGVTAQMSSNTDLDWFSIDYTADSTTTGITTVRFECKGQASSGAIWELATYNPQNVPQASYTITAAQCAATGGFKFSLNTPTTGKYLLLVNAPATTTTGAFSQADYVLTWSPVTTDNTGTSGTVTRLPGELEPNDTQVNAVELTNTEAVIAQLASVDDLDYYYVDNDTSKNPTGVVPIYFGCAVPDSSGVNYVLSYYNSKGVLQGNYTVNAADCSTLPKTTTNGTTTSTAPATNGFKFDMRTPATGRYYVLVSGPADKDPAKFSDADYSISTFLNVSSLISATNTGTLKNATIVDMKAVNKDNFTINMAQCGKGVIKLVGSKLNLVGLDKNAQILVQIGKWSCLTSPAELTVNTSDPAKKTYVYPKPPTPATKPPTGISGTN
jgi:Tfp pilus assembly protein PilE